MALTRSKATQPVITTRLSVIRPLSSIQPGSRTQPPVTPALWSNTGSDNTATGANALYFHKSGLNNTASGSFALWLNTAGSNNTAMGANALGGTSSGSNNIAFGYSAGVHLQGSNNIDVGNEGVAGDSGCIRIGTTGTHITTFIAGIRDACSWHSLSNWHHCRWAIGCQSFLRAVQGTSETDGQSERSDFFSPAGDVSL
jgi:hypothetical protein